MPSDNLLTKYILAFTGLVTLIISVLVFIHPPAIFPDPGWGFHVMRSMQMGAPCNTLANPDTEDISKNTFRFLSWWSPGQYLAPYFFVALFKLNLGQSTALIAGIGSFIGLAGFYTFFKKIGFTSLISAISIAFIASQQAYFIPFVFYNGGEILLFAFSGWFLYGCACFKKADWLLIVFILLSGLVGFFCKSSFLWIYLSGALFLWTRLSNGKKLLNWLINGFTIGVPAILSLAIIQFAYLSKGDNPASDSLGIKLTWESFSFPLASPLLAGFSIDDLTGGIINRPIIILVLLALLSLALVVYICKTNPNKNYVLLICIFYTVAVVFYGINFLRQANISYEARHMRLIGLIITPGIIFLLSRIKPQYQMVLMLVWVFILYKNYRFIHAEYNKNIHEAAHGATGLAQIFIDQPTLTYVTRLDDQQRNAIFVFISNDIGLEIKHNRIITFNPLDDDLVAENLYTYKGHAGPVYMVLPVTFKGAKAGVYMKSFPGYHNFTVQQTSKDYLIYSAQ